MAPTTDDASQDTSTPTTLLTLTYDPQFGNLIQVTGSNPAGATQQCTQINYDSAFSQLPVRTTQFRGGCGGVPLTTSRAYDRGLERVTMEVSPSEEVYSATYDAFGRLLTASAPDAATPLHSDPNPTVTIAYNRFDPPPPPIDPTSPPAPLPTFPVRVLGVSRNVGLEGQPTYSSRWKYFDGSGRQLVTVEQSENAGQWVVEGATAVGGSTGRVTQAWRPFFDSLADGAAYDVQVAPAKTVPSATATYDALSEITARTDELGRLSKATYLPAVFSQQLFDAAQVAGTHTGSTTIRHDGHGRLASTTATIANPQTDSIVTALSYLATGEVTTVTKTDSATSASFVRSMKYDSRGRLVENAEPNTSFTPLVAAGSTSTAPHDWRYAYNDSGQLVGTSDARGCGENMQYDDLGRLVGEDYSPCESYQPAYSAGNYVTGEGLEAFYKYDVPETTFTHGVFYRGHLTATYDRGQNTRLQLDGRGRVTEIDRRLGGPLSFDGIAGAYSSHVFARRLTYDEANRVVTASTGADVADLVPAGGSTMTTAYTVRDGVSAVQMPYSSGQLLGKRTFDASNNVLNEVYGSHATPGPSQSLRYYPNETLEELVTNGPLVPGGSGKGGASFAVIQDLVLSYDQVDNPTSIHDASPTAWPAGILPAQHTAKYDDLYRVTSVATTYGPSGGTDAFSIPYAAEVLAGSQAFPATVVPQKASTRVQSQTFAYDFLDNVQTSTDDQSDVPDRSFGQAQYGAYSLFRPAPNQFVASSNANGAGVAATYDPAGNTTSMTVTYATLPGGGCSNGAAPPCVSTYFYGWDEVGRLLYSARYDGGYDSDDGTPPPATVAFVYTYDASGARVARRADIAQTDGTQETSFSVTVFPSLRLENTSPDSTDGYELNDETEVVYLQDGAGATYGRAFYEPNGDPAAAGAGAVHVYLEFGDHLGSMSAVVDFDTGALVEKSSYLAYGGVDADYRPGGFREPYRYTGHHDDSEVGLTYFGARYYIPTLARWASPDPLTIHGLGSSLNPYAFVHGSPLGDVDPFGLYGEDDGVQPSPIEGFGLTFQIDWFGGGGSGGGSGSTFAGGRTPPPAQAPFIFQQWNLATAGTFQTPQAGATPSWALASALQTHNGEGWKALANIGLDLLAEALKPAFAYPNVSSLLPRFRIDPHDDAAVAYDAMHAIVVAGAMIASDGLSEGGAAVEETVEKAVSGAVEGPEAAGTAAKFTASTPQSAIALSKQLASEAQLGEMAAGAGRPIAGPGAAAVFRDAARIANTYGGNAADWAKMSSSGFRAADGTTFATHWVENVVTGAQAEPKVVIDIIGGP